MLIITCSHASSSMMVMWACSSLWAEMWGHMTHRGVFDVPFRRSWSNLPHSELHCVNQYSGFKLTMLPSASDSEKLHIVFESVASLHKSCCVETPDSQMTVQLNPTSTQTVMHSSLFFVWAKEFPAAGLKVEVGCCNNELKYNEQ